MGSERAYFEELMQGAAASKSHVQPRMLRNSGERSFAKSFIVAALCVTTFQAVAGEIADPLRDYLQMDVPERREFLDQYRVIYRAECDIDGDGKDDVLVGIRCRIKASCAPPSNLLYKARQ